VNALAGCLAAALVHFLWQGALIAAVLWVATRGTDEPRVRHDLSVLALFAMLAAPAVTFAALWWVHPHEMAPTSLVEASSVALRAHGSFGLHVPTAQAIVGAWGAGVCAMGLRLAGGLVRLRRLTRDAVVLEGEWPERALRVARRLGVRGVVRVARSAKMIAPVVVGWLRPIVLLPAGLLLELSAGEVEALLAHELAHVRRHDWLVNLAQTLVEGVLFYHPCVYWVSRQIEAAREECCDDAAVAALAHPMALARALAAAESSRARSLALSMSLTGGSLMQRVRRLVTSPARRPSPLSRARWRAPAFAAGSILVIGALPFLACASSANPDASTALTQAQTTAPDALGIPWLPGTVKRWSPQIMQAANRHGIDPELLAIILMMESNGDPDAVSPSGSIGLVQVQPDTAKRIDEERGTPGGGSLRDPATNLDYGAYYLSEQLKTFGEIALAAAAYNGGPDAVRAWLSGHGQLSDETRHYQARVAELWAHRHTASSRGAL
jgi:soluble lytic murein transglycosylase-like protein